jgi:hypothetical protein
MIPDPSPPFDVILVGTAQRNIVDLLARSAALGFRTEVEQLLSRVDEELRFRPRTWGDPIRNHPTVQTVQFRGKAEFLLAYYFVHDRLPWVFLSTVTVPKGHPLSQGEA